MIFVIICEIVGIEFEFFTEMLDDCLPDQFTFDKFK